MATQKKKSESDNYCWTCHRDGPALFCSTCVRSFHPTPSCTHSKHQSAQEMKSWRCQDCIEIEKDEAQHRDNKIDNKHFQSLLKDVYKQMCIDELLAESFGQIEYSLTKNQVTNALDLNAIGEKILANAYSCLEAFWSDVKWIAHNTKVHRSAEKVAVKNTAWLLKLAKEMIYSIRLCHECYLNAVNHPSDWMTMVCKQPHLLIWAKQKSYPFWPAKLMSVNDDKGTVDVRFFDDERSRAILKPKDCLMYSQKSPNATVTKSKALLERGEKEAKVYIQNIITKFGSFSYYEDGTPLNIDHLERHLYDSIPGAWKLLGKSEIPSPIAKPTAPTNTLNRKTVASKNTATAPTSAAVSTSRRINQRQRPVENSKADQEQSSDNGGEDLASSSGLSSAKTKPSSSTTIKVTGSNVESLPITSPPKKRKLSNEKENIRVPPKKIVKITPVTNEKKGSRGTNSNTDQRKVASVPTSEPEDKGERREVQESNEAEIQWTSHMVEQELQKQQTKHDAQINRLQSENDDLKTQLMALTAEKNALVVQNYDLNKRLGTKGMENAKPTGIGGNIPGEISDCDESSTSDE